MEQFTIEQQREAALTYIKDLVQVYLDTLPNAVRVPVHNMAQGNLEFLAKELDIVKTEQPEAEAEE